MAKEHFLKRSALTPELFVGMKRSKSVNKS